MTKKQVEQIYKKLSEIEHVLLRPGRYIGSISNTPTDTYIINNNTIEWKNISYNPGFLKLFDEIITNSADFSKRAEGKHLDKIDVAIDKSTGRITVIDNGGIPVVKHSEYDQYIPDMIFGELRSGSNFNDEEKSDGAGQNGEGSTLTNIFSKEFIVETADGKNRFLCTYYDNMNRKDVPKVSKTTKNFTKISYLPDYQRLNMTLDDDNYTMLVRRVYEIAATNTHLKVFLNGNLINFKSFKDYVKLFSDNKIDFGNDRFQISVFHSKNGFQQIGFINSTNVSQGGTHIDYVMNQIVAGIRDYVKKKTKQDVKPSDIKNHFFLMINATINNPRYNSQTKEFLQTSTKDYGVSVEIDDKTLQKIIKSDIVASIIEWAENKAALAAAQALKDKNKELSKSGNSLKEITKYEPATSKDRSKTVLFLSEGDCLEQNTLIVKYDPTENRLLNIPIKDLNVNDYVLSDKNRLRKILTKTNKVIDGIKINTIYGEIIMSPDHKLIVYDKLEKLFTDIQAKDIKTERHNLIKNKIVEIDHTAIIKEILELDSQQYDLKITYGSDDIEDIIYSSYEHKFFIWDAQYYEFKMISAKDLNIKNHQLVMRIE